MKRGRGIRLVEEGGFEEMVGGWGEEWGVTRLTGEVGTVVVWGEGVGGGGEADEDVGECGVVDVEEGVGGDGGGVRGEWLE